VTTSKLPLVHSTDPLITSKDLCTTSSTQQPTPMSKRLGSMSEAIQI
jgi:hypothetical protein